MQKPHVPQAMNQAQVQNILKFIDTTLPEADKAQIFSRLGHECFYSRNLDAWIGKYVGNVQAFLDWVNVEGASRYWEKLEFNADHTQLVLTGRVVEGCACAFADCTQPPLALCQHCCKSLQEALFSTLFEQPVEVEITAAFLLGDQRCNTIIHLV